MEPCSRSMRDRARAKVTPVGLEPAQPALVELAPAPLDRSGEVSLAHPLIFAFREDARRPRAPPKRALAASVARSVRRARSP